jgi:hypothetical protein
MSFPGAPLSMPNALQWCRKLAETINTIMLGRTNNTGTITLTANVASTTVSLASGQLSTVSAIIFEPLTANAAADLYGGGMYVTTANHDVAGNKFVITHPNNANADKTFRYAIIG